MKLNYQPYPTTGRLASNMNSHLAKLKAKIGPEQADVYCYIVATIKNRNGSFFQTGSAPNFQGGLITLCTCKHFMRTFIDTEEWIGKWIAGFTGVGAGYGHNALVNLMKVADSFKSQQSLWFSDTVSKETKRAKSAHISKFGDIYQPINQTSDPFAPSSYIRPLENHVHAENNGWHNDIDYEGCKGRKAALLIGNPGNSFLWNKPVVYYEVRLHRGQKKGNLRMLLEQLKEPAT